MVKPGLILKHLLSVQAWHLNACSLTSTKANKLKMWYKFSSGMWAEFSEQSMRVMLTQWDSYSQLLFNLLCEVVSTTVLSGHRCIPALWVFLRLCGCGYSPCGLPWFQGKVWPIPPISGASLRDILGSLMLSIVGGTKPLSVSASSISSFPHLLFFFLSSCHSSPAFLLTHISTAGI